MLACSVRLACRNLDTHVRELAKVCSAGRREAIILVEAALAVMRLSCEKLFVLVAVFVAFLLFRDDVPGYARVLIRTNHHISTIFQRVWPWSRSSDSDCMLLQTPVARSCTMIGRFGVNSC